VSKKRELEESVNPPKQGRYETKEGDWESNRGDRVERKTGQNGK
jgi:hypothetical protein